MSNMISLRLLVVDDETGMRKGVARGLRNFHVRVSEMDEEVDFVVDEATTAEEALQMIAESPPDLILLDLKLPGMSGLDALENIVADSLDLLTIMITAYASIEMAVTATKRGAFDFLAKPFTPKELKETIRKATIHLLLTRNARRMAREKRHVRFQFISVLAHELKAPLGAIEGYLNIIEAHTLGDDLAPYEGMVERCLCRIDGMRKMIADLTDLTRIEAGSKKRELVDIDFLEVAKTAIETSTPAADERDIAIAIKAPQTLVMLADRGEIESVFNNLISNAVKYNRNGGKVEVALSLVDAVVAIRVTDTGIGMTPEEAARLFKEFVRIRNEKTKDILGSGLGLSIVKKIALLYDGNAHLERSDDTGSTFTVELKVPETHGE
jgi:two-component system, sensor histidine kinase and response regulator